MGGSDSTLYKINPATGVGFLRLENSSDDRKDKLVFKWLSGAETEPSDFGDPRSSADYALASIPVRSGTRSPT